MFLALKAFLSGFGHACRRIQLAFWLYLAVLGFGVIVSLPMVLWLDREVGHSAMGEVLSARFDLEALTDFQNAGAGLLRGHVAFLGFAAILFMLLQTFLKGGILDALLRGKGVSFREFCRGCGGAFWRFIRLYGFLAVGLVALHGLNRLLTGLYVKWSLYSRLGDVVDWVGFAKVLVMLLLAGGLAAVLTIASIHIVAEDVGATRAFFRAVAFSLANAFRVVFLCLWSAVLPAATLAFYGWLVATQDWASELWPMIGVQQGAVCLLCFFRVHWFASFSSLYELRKEVRVAAEREASMDFAYPPLGVEEIAAAERELIAGEREGAR